MRFDKRGYRIAKFLLTFIVLIGITFFAMCLQDAKSVAEQAGEVTSTTGKTMTTIKVSQTSKARKVVEAKPATKKKIYKYAKKQLKCKKKPNKKSKTIGTFRYNKKLRVIKVKKKWVLVKGKAKSKSKKVIKGYVRKKYLSKKKLKKKTSKYKKVYIGTYKLTFYCACATCNGNTHRITSSGARLTNGVTIAVNRSEISLGTKVYIEGDKG